MNNYDITSNQPLMQHTVLNFDTTHCAELIHGKLNLKTKM